MFNKGDQVMERGSLGAVGTVILGPEVHGGEQYFRVNFNGKSRYVPAEDLIPFEGEQDIETLLRVGKFGDHAVYARRLTLSKLRRKLRDTVYSYKASRTQFYAYQFKPLLKFLASERRRLLIADEVGLGKTIEAGYILQEEKARFEVRRVLVVCPASLRIKWQREMWERFCEEFDVFDRNAFLRKGIMQADEAERSVPRMQGIVSLQSLRGDKVIERIEASGGPLDLLIVDEAHHCRNPETKQHRAVRALADLAEAAVFLTATPVHLGDQNLFNLFRLLVPEEFDSYYAFEERLSTNAFIVETEALLRRGGDEWRERAVQSLKRVEGTPQADRFMANPLYLDSLLTLTRPEPPSRSELVRLQEDLSQLNLLTTIMTRTRRRDVYPDAAKREAHVITVELSSAERRVYEALSEYCFQQYAIWKGEFAARFALITFQRQLASSLFATIAHYRKVIGEQETSPDDAMEDAEDDTEIGWDGDAKPQAGGWLASSTEFRDMIEWAADELRGTMDRKREQFLKIIEAQKKVVVFAYFKKSLGYLEDLLNEAGIPCARIDGDVPSNPHDPEDDERYRRINRFRDDPKVRVLLSSEVGSEGLDFQFCHVLVNWDLPWNPMVVEQRIGRLDRLGQRSPKILIFSFSCPGTIEETILSRLYSRIGVFERTIGVLEPILGQEIRELTEQLFDARLSLEEREHLVDQRAAALVQQAVYEEALERESANLVGQDEYFSEEMERVSRLGRFVTGEELRVFVSEFLEREHPISALTLVDATEDEGMHYRTKVAEPLREFVRRAMPRNDPDLMRFLDRSVSGKVKVTFDHQAAMENPRLELITVRHPLVRAVAARYDADATLIHPVTAVQISSDAVPPGEYMFGWAAVTETGLRAGLSLWAEAMEVGTDVSVDGEAAEMLLHHMVVRGQRWEDFEAPPAEFTADLFDRLRDHIARRHAAYRAEAKRRNQAMVEQRLASLEASFRVKLGERQRRLDENIRRENEKVIPLFRRQIEKLEAEHEERTRQIEQQRDLSVSWDIEGAGYVRVVEQGSWGGA